MSRSNSGRIEYQKVSDNSGFSLYRIVPTSHSAPSVSSLLPLVPGPGTQLPVVPPPTLELRDDKPPNSPAPRMRPMPRESVPPLAAPRESAPRSPRHFPAPQPLAAPPPPSPAPTPKESRDNRASESPAPLPEVEPLQDSLDASLDPEILRSHFGGKNRIRRRNQRYVPQIDPPIIRHHRPRK